MPTIAEKAERFRELHARPGTFIIPNPFDAGSARILQHLGFEALATTSSGYAYSTGRMDYGITRDDAIAHAKILVDATDIPVSADLENGFGDDPDTVAETVRMAAGVGRGRKLNLSSTGNSVSSARPDSAACRSNCGK